MTSSHARDRIDNRLKNLITPIELNKLNMATRANKSLDKVYIVIKKFGKTITIEEAGYTGGNGKGLRGDALVAVVKLGELTTVMLSHSKDRKYFSDAPMVH